MGKLESGPDMLDCLMFLHQVESTHECSTSILIVSGGTIIAPVAYMTVLSVPLAAPPWQASAGTGCNLRWPSMTHKTFEGAFYALLCEHDYQLTMKKNIESRHNR